MKSNNLILLAGLGIGAYLLLASNTGSANHTYNGLDLSYLSSYGSDNLTRLENLENELSNRGLSDLQQKMLLAQALQETGIFTDVANYRAVDTLHNYAGISYNGQLASYNSISDFVDDWLRVLNKGTQAPIDANNISDFNSRLKANGYYTDSANTYGKNLTYYFNLLNQA